MNRVALVTGAGRGLGAEIARTLAAAGMAVAVNDMTESAEATAVVEQIRAAGGTAELVAGDVTDETAVAALVRQTEDRLGPVDVLVPNATGPQPAASVEELTWELHLGQLLFFVKSPTLLVQAVLPGMKDAGRGRIINIGSDLFERAAPGMSAYSAAKGAMLGRFGEPAEVAAVVAFLASDAAAFVTGERIAVNGGHIIA